jgi:transposase
MEGLLPPLRGCAKERLIRNLRKCRDAKMRVRYLIIVNLMRDRSPVQTAAALQVHRSTVYRVATRFREWGEAGLVDRREDNGSRKVDEAYLETLHKVVAGTPLDYGEVRPTWTLELLVRTLARRTGVKIHISTMSVALRLIHARRGRPKPTVGCPWPEARKTRRLRWIRRLIANLPANEVAVWADEVDIHLNPKIGLDWMLRGQQKRVLTPGQNQKRYLAGAQDVRTRRLVWTAGDRKNSLLFLWLLWELLQAYPKARLIHVIVDNYSIHSTQQVKLALQTEVGQRLRLHFLPPYCPDDNRIERTWQDLHANVTRNHRCRRMSDLMHNVRRYLHRHNRNVNRTVA